MNQKNLKRHFRSTRYGLWLFAVLFSWFAFSCEAERAFDDQPENSQKVSGSLETSTEKLLLLAELPTEVAFPHPANFSELSEHGVLALVEKGKLCQSCHGQDLQGGTSGVSCTECHANYPHTAWSSPGDHAPVAAKDPAQCEQCHGNPLHQKLAGSLFEPLMPKNCISCHQYPHPKGFASPQAELFHGVLAKKEGLESCAQCHGADFKGEGDESKSCFSCHAFPHGADFKNKGKHGFSFLGLLKENKAGECLSCHLSSENGSSERSGSDSSSAPACTSCHSFPHPAGFASPKQHGELVKTHGADSAKCFTCHKSDEAASTSSAESLSMVQAPSCKKCHEYPHPQEWEKGKEHGKVAHGDLQSESCISCHGKDLSGGSSKVSCGQCHESYPHDQKWFLPEKHGQFVLSKGQSNTTCALCHEAAEMVGGSMLIAEESPNATSMNQHEDRSKPCQSCHESYPHGKDWNQREKHGLFVHQESPDAAQCQTCHGKDLQGGSSGVSCSSCHAGYPHSEEFKSGAVHGKDMLDLKTLDQQNCKTCHGENYEGTATTPSCFSCHNYPHPEKGWKAKGSHSTVLSELGSIKKADCHMCHLGETYSEGSSGKKCQTCHNHYPHSGSFTNLSLDPNEKPLHHSSILMDETIKADKLEKRWDGCQKCHSELSSTDATEAKDPAAPKNCYRCHAGEKLEFTDPSKNP